MVWNKLHNSNIGIFAWKANSNLTYSLRDQTGTKMSANKMVPFKIDSYVLKCLLKAIKWYKV